MMQNDLDILAIGVHPDDVELGCGGTLAKQIAQGAKVGILDLTQGELGTRGSAEIRLQEAANAADILGVLFRENAGFADGFFENDAAHKLSLISYIRHFRPGIVLANAPSDRHPDHGRAATLVAEACYYSGLSKIETSKDGKKQDAFRPKALYHYIQDKYLQPDFVVDISGFEEKKMQAVMAFASQFYKENDEEPETPISSKSFYDFVIARLRTFGREAGFSYAEGFVAARTIGVSNILTLI